MGLFCCSLSDVSTETSCTGSGNTWPLYCDWALASHVVEYASIVFVYICNIYLRYNNKNIGTSM